MNPEDWDTEYAVDHPVDAKYPPEYWRRQDAFITATRHRLKSQGTPPGADHMNKD